MRFCDGTSLPTEEADGVSNHAEAERISQVSSTSESRTDQLEMYFARNQRFCLSVSGPKSLSQSVSSVSSICRVSPRKKTDSYFFGNSIGLPELLTTLFLVGWFLAQYSTALTGW